MTTATINPVEVETTTTETIVKVKTTMFARIKSAVSIAYNSVKQFVVGLATGTKEVAVTVAQSAVNFGKALIAGFWMIGSGAVDMVASWIYRVGYYMSGSKIRWVKMVGFRLVGFAHNLAGVTHMTAAGRMGATLLGYASMYLVSISLVFAILFAGFMFLTEKVNDKQILAVVHANQAAGSHSVSESEAVQLVSDSSLVQVVDATAGEAVAVTDSDVSAEDTEADKEDVAVATAVLPEVRSRRSVLARQLRADFGTSGDA